MIIHLAPEKIKGGASSWMSPYQHRLIDELGITSFETEKLVPNLMDKSRYVLHYRNSTALFVAWHGDRQKFTKFSQFHQTPWMQPYILKNTRNSGQQPRMTFEKDFLQVDEQCRKSLLEFSVLSVSNLCKLCELSLLDSCLTGLFFLFRCLARRWKMYEKELLFGCSDPMRNRTNSSSMLPKPTFAQSGNFQSNTLVGIQNHKEKVLLNISQFMWEWSCAGSYPSISCMISTIIH